MDAHHDQVQRARALAQGGASRHYFAYSTVLDRPAFLEWRDQHGYQDFELPAGQLAEARGQALVFDFPSRWWGGRVAGLASDPRGRVWGRLFEIPAGDWAIVQHKEGAITGMSVEVELEVFVDGNPMRATAFTTAPQRRADHGPVSPRFLEALRRGAAAAQLPADYLAALNALR